ncbi:MAG: hypothetical protein SF029_10015 [bacterium]|nr:hypothetical protein [bacterium]
MRGLFGSILIGLGLLLTACGGGGAEATDEAEMRLEQELANTAIPPNTVVSRDGRLALQYPESWLVRESEGLLIVANSEEALVAETPVEGQVIATLSGIDDSTLPIYGLTAGAAPVDVLNAYVALNNAESASQIVLAPPAAFDAGGRPAALGTGTVGSAGASGDAVSGAIYMIVQGEGGYGLLVVRAPEGEIAGQEATVRELAAGVVYRASEANN